MSAGDRPDRIGSFFRDDEGVSAIIIDDWPEASRQAEIPSRVARRLPYVLMILAAVLAVIAISWPFLAWRAAQTGDLRRERDLLLAREDSIRMLAEQLAALASREDQLRFLSGLEERREPDIWLRGTAGSGVGDQEPEYAPGDTALTPTVWPLTEGEHITQSFIVAEEGRHPGIDIAAARGSYVRAAGAGRVLEVAEDSIYGLFVLIDHGSGVWSRYGHALYLAVNRGQMVRKGEVIALLGNTGQSTAPHLHFEITRNGQPLDPLSMVSLP